MVPAPRAPKAARSKAGLALARSVPGRAGARPPVGHVHAAPRWSGAPPLAAAGQPAAGQLVGDHGGVDVGQLADGGGDPVGGAVVEEPVPSGREPPARQQDGELGGAGRPPSRRPAPGRPGSSRRSSHSMTSRGSRVRPRRLHSASRAADSRLSRAKWTARSSSGWRVRAYWRARAVAMSSRSTSTMTTWRESTGASAASAAPSSSCSSSLMYCRWRLDQPEVHERADHHHHPGPLLELHGGEDEDDDGRQRRRTGR